MPRLDKDMEDGRIANWQVSEGDSVGKGDVLFEIETEKAAVEVEAEIEGILHHIDVRDGESADVDATIAWIYAADEKVGAAPVEVPQASAAPAPTVARPSDAAPPRALAKVAPPVVSSNDSGRISITPAARQAAHTKGISPKEIQGSGPDGRVQLSDILSAPAHPAPSSPPISARAANNPGALSVITSGRDDRLPMVMIHGFLSDATAWEKLAQPLGRSRRIHRIELPCHGRSPNRVPRDFSALAAELRHAFDALDTGPCHLIGHSLGGAVALALADTRPRKIESLTLISPAGLGPDINGEMLKGMCRATRAESLGPWMKLLTSNPDDISWSFVQAAAALRRDPDLRAAQTAMADALFPDGVQGFDLIPALQRAEMPTRIIWGRDDRVISWKHALRAPGRVSLNLFSRTGHLPQYEAADEILPFFEAAK
ncbi:MAG: acetoin dehydrogenase dihydrolipoyllysine-residue acetyltransferase subunit [Sulfitobacter sp.]